MSYKLKKTRFFDKLPSNHEWYTTIMNMIPDEKSQKISTTHYAGIERGEENPTFSVIENICKALKIKSSQVLPF